MPAKLLRRYWIRFGGQMAETARFHNGCGVTAYSLEDALTLIKEVAHIEVPSIECVIEDVDVSTLDERHILPNIGITTYRGVWYPKMQ